MSKQMNFWSIEFLENYDHVLNCSLDPASGMKEHSTHVLEQ